MTKEALLKWTRKLHDEAYAIDPIAVDEACEAMIGPIWIWSNLSVPMLHKVASFMLIIARM